MTPDELHLAETLALLALPDDATPEDKAKALAAAREAVEDEPQMSDSDS
jgi:hypothetical protein